MSEALQKEMTKEEQQILINSFAGKLCPMSMAGARPVEQSKLAFPPGMAQQPQAHGEVIGCQGTACMWFRIITDEKGRVTGGECAIALLSFQLAMMPRQLADLGKLRFTPNGG